MKYFGVRAWLTRHKGFLCLLLLLKVVENLLWWELSANGFFDYIDFAKNNGAFLICLILAGMVLLLGCLIFTGSGRIGWNVFALLILALHVTYWVPCVVRQFPYSHYRDMIEDGFIPFKTSVQLRLILGMNLMAGISLAILLASRLRTGVGRIPDPGTDHNGGVFDERT